MDATSKVCRGAHCARPGNSPFNELNFNSQCRGLWQPWEQRETIRRTRSGRNERKLLQLTGHNGGGSRSLFPDKKLVLHAMTHQNLFMDCKNLNHVLKEFPQGRREALRLIAPGNTSKKCICCLLLTCKEQRDVYRFEIGM